MNTQDHTYAHVTALDGNELECMACCLKSKYINYKDLTQKALGTPRNSYR